MKCVQLSDIVATHVSYENIFNYEELFVMSSEKLVKFFDIIEKYEDKQSSKKRSFFREFNYKFKDDIEIGRVIFSDEYIIESFEIYNIENENKKVLINKSQIKKKNGHVYIDVGVKVQGLSIKLESNKNLWPKVDDIKLSIM